MTTALVLYGSTVASTTLTNACKLSITTGGTSTSKTTTCTDGTSSHFWYMECFSQGGSNGDIAALPAPTGHGYLLDNISLENQIISAGNWSAIVRMDDSVGFASVDLIIRAYVYNSVGLTYTVIGTLHVLGVALTSTATNYTMPNVSLAATTFNTNDKLYFDHWVFANGAGGHWNLDPIVSFSSSNAAAGIANQFVVTTPGYVPSLVTNITNFSEIAAIVEAENVVTLPSLIGTTASTEAALLDQTNSTITDLSAITEVSIALSSPNIATITTTTTSTTTTSEVYSVQSLVTINDPASWSDFFSLIGVSTQNETIVVSDVTINTQYRPLVDITASVDTVITLPIQVSFDTTRLIEAYTSLGIESIIETIASQESVLTAASSPVPVDPASQMLYATLQLQYARLRASTTNTHIQIMAIVYYISSTAQIASEYSIPGEIDILLTGETLDQLHVLKTVNDVTAFIAAYP